MNKSKQDISSKENRELKEIAKMIYKQIKPQLQIPKNVMS